MLDNELYSFALSIFSFYQKSSAYKFFLLEKYAHTVHM